MAIASSHRLRTGPAPAAARGCRSPGAPRNATLRTAVQADASSGSSANRSRPAVHDRPAKPPLTTRSAVGALLRHAIDLGVDHVDTAEFYGNGFVNSVIRDALRPEDDVSIVSKVGAVSDPGGPFPMRVAQRPEELRAGVEANLATLGVERIPVVNLRRMDVGFTPPIPDDQVIEAPFHDVAAFVALAIEGRRAARWLPRRARLRAWSARSGVGCAIPRRRSQKR